MKVNIIPNKHKEIEAYIRGDSSKGHDIWGAKAFEDGYIFRLYAPNADEVYLKGDFSNWEAVKMTKNKKYGYFFTFQKAKIGQFYKYTLIKDGRAFDKADPYAFFLDREGDFGTQIIDDSYTFNDQSYLKERDKNFTKPLNIYELHISSFLGNSNKLGLMDIVDRLIAYVKKMNYTHVELMPITEYPYYPSWGYQATGFFAVSHRYGSPKDFKNFVDLLHQNDIGVILDVVPVHFAGDFFGLDHFDGTSLYESEYMDLKYSQWGSNNFDYSKGHVRSFMKSSISYLISEFHLDGVRMDAISYMIYYNGNSSRGEHKDNITFLKNLNQTLEKEFPQVMKIAEDSTSYPLVTDDVSKGGLGFDYKWDMGWMNDSLKYFEIDSIHRNQYHNLITFSMYYFYKEKYLLALSHDEVVHLKKSLIAKMNGSYEDKFKQLKLLMTYQMTHPGKKLSFMGNDIGVFEEWDENKGINWSYLDYPAHSLYNKFVKDLYKLYLENDAFFKDDYNSSGFVWKVVDDKENSVFAFERISDNSRVLVVLNMCNVYHSEYDIAYDEDLVFTELINSLDGKYGDYKKADRKIEVKKGMNLKLELWQYEAAIFKISKL